MKHYLFFLRHFNDTDNIEPAIYFLLKDKPQAQATVFYYSLDFDFRQNKNLTFLKQTFGERFKVDWIGWHLGINPDLLFRPDYLGSAYNAYTRRAPWRRCLDGVTGRSRFQFPRAVLSNVISKLLNEHGHPKLVIFDQNRTHQIGGLLNSLRQHGVERIISLPVSPFVNINVMRSDRFGSLDAVFLDYMHDYSGFDAVGISDRHYLDSLERTYRLLGRASPLSHHGVPLGSIRFCQEWLQIREKRVAPYSGAGANSKRRLLFLLSQPAANSNWHAVHSSIEMLGHLTEYEVVIKPHTRRFRADLGSLPDNIRVETEVDSSSLVDWADIILFWGTSMALEGYCKSKVMLCADFLNTNEIVFAKYNAGQILRSLDDLHEALTHYADKSTKLGNQQQEDVRTMLFNVVHNGTEESSVPDRYLAFIEKQEQLSEGYLQ